MDVERGAAWRRRQRRLRSWWRHEQQTVAAVLATFQHHSAPRGPRTARTGRGARDELHGHAPEDAPPQAAGTQYFAMDVDDVPAAGGSRPDRLPDVSGPQERVQRRTVQQIVDYPSLPILDDPEPQMVVQSVEVLHFFLQRWPVGAEQVWNCEARQVIDVPKISQDCTQPRLVDTLRQPQTVEQLVEVPTIISFSSLQRTVEQNVGISVVGGSGAGGGLSGFLPGQSYSFTAEQIVDNPV